MKNFYELLEVDRHASKDVIDKAYRVLAKKYHPDANSEENKKWAEDNFKQINEAYETLSNDTKRQEYDKKLNESEVTAEMYNSLLNENKNLKNELNSVDTKIDNSNDNFFSDSTNIPKQNYQPQYTNQYYQPEPQYYYKKAPLIRRILNTERKRNIFALIVTIAFFELLCRLLLLNPNFKSLILTQYYKSTNLKYIIFIINILLFKPLNLK